MSCLRCYVAAGILLVCPCGGLLSAQTPGKIDFQRDIQPIFQAHCIGCHGPSQQMDGLRLDRRSSVFRTARPWDACGNHSAEKTSEAVVSGGRRGRLY